MAPRIAASVMVKLRRASFAMSASAARIARSLQSIVGKWPSLNNSETLSSTTMRHKA
jgi:hypothetical protein